MKNHFDYANRYTVYSRSFEFKFDHHVQKNTENDEREREINISKTVSE